MNLDRYPVITVIPNREFEFFSFGPKGEIRKVVKFWETYDDYYNLSFGDWDKETQGVDDKARSNNEDKDKILATIAMIVFRFMKNNPKAKVIGMGQVPGKTRLYQMAINKHYHEIVIGCVVEGLDGDSWELFKRNRNYDAILVRSKNII